MKCTECQRETCSNCRRPLPPDYDEIIYRPRHEGKGRTYQVCNPRCAGSFLDTNGPYRDTLQGAVEIATAQN